MSDMQKQGDFWFSAAVKAATGPRLGWFLLLLGVLFAGFPSASAQSCPDPWGSSPYIYGTVLLDGTGTGVNGPYTSSTDESAVMQVKMAPEVACEFATLQVPGVGTGSDQIYMQDQVKDTTCAAVQTDSWSGAGPGVNLQVNLGILAFLNTYSFGVYDEVAGTFSESGCVVGSQPQKIGWGPYSTIQEQSIPLPTTVQLAGVKIFSELPLDSAQSNIPANWNLAWSFSPNPDDNCEDCLQRMRYDFASELSIGNQSLGEDISVVGTPFALHYESSRAPGRAGVDAVAMLDAHSLGGWTLNVHHALEPLLQSFCFGGACTPYSIVPKAMFLGDGQLRTDDNIQAPLALNGNLVVASEDGTEIYVFTTHGLHLQTLLPLTGAVMYTFGYDSYHRLVKITDNSGNVTTIQRDVNENVTAIVAPFGQKTVLAVDGNGYLSQVTDPAGLITKLTNNGSGLLTAMTDPLGKTFTFQYDTLGGLSAHTDPSGATISLTRTSSASGYTVTESSAMGRTTSRQVAFTSTSTQNNRNFTNTWENGLQATSSKSLQAGQITEGYALPDGTSYSSTEGPDPRWGMQAPVQTSNTITIGNLTTTITSSRAVTLSTPGNPFSLATETDTESINGRAYTSVFDGSTGSMVHTTPAGRTSTIMLDPLERIISSQLGGLTAATFVYDSHGRVASTTQGTRRTLFTYNSKGFLASVTDPLKLKTSFSYDADGRRTSTTLPDGRVIHQAYDADDNLTTVTPPNGSVHQFAYASLNLPSTYTPPTVSGAGAITYAYDLDHAPTSITRADGSTIAFAHDSAGRLTSVKTPTSTTSLVYNSITGNLTSASRGSQHITYSYDGSLLTKSTWAGTVAGSVARVFNNNQWVTSFNVNGANTVAMGYDKDGLLTKAGSLAVHRSASNGLVSGTTLGVATDTRAYNTYGELTTYTASVSGSPVYTVKFTRDAGGRITARTETIGGGTNTYSYAYDTAGRLTASTKNAETDDFAYDTNSNRLSATTSSGTATATYDAQDRLLNYGSASFTYTANGDLATETASGKNTTYTYDALGNLIAAGLSNGTKLSYTVDGENHRVGKSVNGALQAGFLYDDDDELVAQLDGSNQLAAQFVYATSPNVPDYMVKAGVIYRIFSDHLGSPVLVVNASTGAIVEQIAYDEFGNILSDSNPAFQPFGFAGGLYDADTNLLQFGARDYNPAIGRWTAKDPTLFDGGDTNLYGYVVSDPINLTDPTGLSCGKKKVKKLADKLVKKIAGDSVKIGPVKVSLTKPEMSVGASTGVTVRGKTVVSVNATATVGITATPAPRDSHQWYQDPHAVIYTDVTGKLSVYGQKIADLAHWHNTHWDTSKWGVMPSVRNRYDGYDEKCDGICRDR